MGDRNQNESMIGGCMYIMYIYIYIYTYVDFHICAYMLGYNTVIVTILHFWRFQSKAHFLLVACSKISKLISQGFSQKRLPRPGNVLSHLECAQFSTQPPGGAQDLAKDLPSSGILSPWWWTRNVVSSTVVLMLQPHRIWLHHLGWFKAEVVYHRFQPVQLVQDFATIHRRTIGMCIASH